jgi:hypothetical protein
MRGLLGLGVAGLLLGCDTGSIQIGDGSDTTDTTDPTDTTPPAPGCEGALQVGDATTDACGLAAVELSGLEADRGAADGSAVFGDASCFIVLNLDDVCGPGRVYVGGGLSGNVSGCGGVEGALDAGYLDITAWQVETVAGATVAVTLSGHLEAAVGRRPVTMDVELVDFGEAPTVSADLTTCSTTPRVDTFTVGEGAKLDVLFVVDDSGSMAEEQQALADAFPALFEAITSFSQDYHVGVVSTDVDDPAKSGKLQGYSGGRFIDASTPNPVAVFQDMAALGTDGSGDEQGRRAAYLALTPPLVTGYNAGFYREDALLAIVVLSDENDSSGNAPSRNDFITFLNELKGDPSLTSFSAIVGPQQSCETAASGSEYLAVSAAVGGAVVNICNGDYAAALPTDLPAIGGAVTLPAPAVPDSVSVEQVLPGGTRVPLERGVAWALDDSSTIRFDGALVPGNTEVVVTWTPAR